MNLKRCKNICKSVTKKIFNIANLSFLIVITSNYELNAQASLDLTTLKGTWKGTISESLATSTKKTTYPITMLFNKYEAGEFKTTQIYKKKGKTINDTFQVSIQGDIEPPFLHLVYNTLGVDRIERCDVVLFLKYTFKSGVSKLEGESNSGTNNCNNIEISLTKESNNFNLVNSANPLNSTSKTSSNLTPTNTEISITAAKLFKTVRRLTSNDEAQGEIVKLDISDKEKLDIVQKSGLKTHENDTLFIDNNNNNPFESTINVTDINEDGEYEIVVWKHNRMGPSGASEFTIYYKPKGGVFRDILSNYGFPIVTDVKNNNFKTIIIGGPGFRFPELFWNGNKYVFLRTISMEPKKPVDASKLVGGSTPEELGKILLKALKTNNRELWINCIHPTEDTYTKLSQRRFKEFRDWIEQDGVSNWDLVQFSRVTYDKVGFGAKDNGIVNGEQVRRNFVIEFTYKNKEFLGGLGSMTIETYKKGNYFIFFPGKDTRLIRYKKR